MLTANADSMGHLIRRMHDINISTIPLSPFDLIAVNRWQIATYHSFAPIMDMTAGELAQLMSPRAFSFYSPTQNVFFIVYNSDTLVEKIYFNLAHEIGHIFYGHVSDQRTLMSTRDRDKLERDKLADQFASFVLQIQ